MRAFFWPVAPAPNPGAIARLGRVAHWAALAVAAGLVLLGLLSDMEADERVLPLAAAVIVASIGRGTRYVMAGE